MHDLRTASSISTSERNDSATVSSASFGHAVNQLIVQQLTSDGNLRSRVRNASPIGDMHNTTWRFLRQIVTKRRHIETADMSVIPSSFAFGTSSSRMFATSSCGNRLGTSPVFSTLLMSSTNDSSLICVSENRKTVGFPSTPAWRSSSLRSSRHAAPS